MALDFPASPTVGQKYPQPAVSGVPVYTWDGEKWTTLGGAIGSTGASDAIPAPDTTAGAAGSSTLWSRGDHSHPALTAPYVRYDASQSLTAPQQQQARQNVYAAPFDALAYNGMQVNGAFDVSQELGTTGISTSGYACDGWGLTKVGTAAVTAVQQPTAIFPGLPNFLTIAVQTAQAAMGAGDLIVLQTSIEGLRCSRLAWGTVNAQPVTIGFWSAHHRAGLYSGSVRNGANNRSYAFTYTQSVADVPQFNIVTVPGDTTGTWRIDNGAGLVVTFAAACGTTYTAPTANVWAAGNYVAAPGQVNAVAATSDFFRLTGVIVLPGNEAPSAARSPFVMRSYDQELVTCQRYLQGLNGNGFAGFCVSTSLTRLGVSFSPQMRATPTLLVKNPAAVAVNTLSANAVGSAISTAAGTPGPNGILLDVNTATANLTAGQPCVASFSPGALFFDARL